VHLTFLGNADEPVVARLIKNYGVDVNIISGKIDYLKDMPYGTLLVEISGSKESLATALDYIHQAKVKEEVIGYVS
jgi:D-methionine transport system ATP-binding protein